MAKVVTVVLVMVPVIFVTGQGDTLPWSTVNGGWSVDVYVCVSVRMCVYWCVGGFEDKEAKVRRVRGWWVCVWWVVQGACVVCGVRGVWCGCGCGQPQLSLDIGDSCFK